MIMCNLCLPPTSEGPLNGLHIQLDCTYNVLSVIRWVCCFKGLAIRLDNV